MFGDNDSSLAGCGERHDARERAGSYAEQEAKLTYPFKHPQGTIMSKPLAIGKRVYQGTNVDK